MPTDGPERTDERQRSLQFRVAGLGLEFGAGIAGCVLFGYWVDRTFGTAETEFGYDVTADGARFLANCDPPDALPSAITVVVNWQSKMK